MPSSSPTGMPNSFPCSFFKVHALLLTVSNCPFPHHRQGYALARESGVLRSQILDQLKAFTCDDNPVSVLATCINDGDLCSSEGTCNSGVCVCNSTRTGAYCERIITDSSSDTTTILLGATPQFPMPTCNRRLCLLIFSPSNPMQPLSSQRLWSSC